MMTDKYYSTIGLSLDTLRLLEEARKHPAFLDHYGKSTTISDVIEWIVRHGVIRVRTDPVLNELQGGR